ncbi:hypothetical protein HK104_002385 [Borealophlyctis nickersoniae]|nr:hypothetical protein HK104_002385 [Borealophlyctis nickersoniae]
MQVTHTTHPPGGASALAAVLGPDPVWHLGYYYVLCPVALGACLLLFIAVLVNNAFGRAYPQYWITPHPIWFKSRRRNSYIHSTLPGDGGKDVTVLVNPSPEMVIDYLDGGAEVRGVVMGGGQEVTEELERAVEEVEEEAAGEGVWDGQLEHEQ